jgi:hypothetical protein
MKTTVKPRPVAGPVSAALHEFWSYLDRLAGAWDHPTDRDLDVLDVRRVVVEHALDAVPEDQLPPDTRAHLASLRGALDRARAAAAEVRMRHLATAGEAAERLRRPIPADM